MINIIIEQLIEQNALSVNHHVLNGLDEPSSKKNSHSSADDLGGD